MRQRVGRAALAARASARPRVRVAALMLLDGKVVLVRHRAGNAVYHLLPGGGVDYRETLETAILREIAEETGLTAKIGRPLFISDTIDPAGTRHVINITFEAQITGGDIADKPQDERVEAVELIAPEDLESLDLRPPMAQALLRSIRKEAIETEYLGSLFTPGP